MRIPYFQVNAFTSQPFGGNPAGVCPLERWLPDDLLQEIAAENNLSETAFFVRQDAFFQLRWFTPVVEVDLCGHATLASAFVLFFELGYREQSITFKTLSGSLAATRRGDLIELDFPSRPAAPSAGIEQLAQALGRKPSEVFKSRDYLVVYPTAADVAALRPDMDLLAKLDTLGIIATGPDSQVDFVSRFFAPRAGIPEDPVTGSAHCTLIPFWAGRLGKSELRAKQISRRGGDLFCRHAGDRVAIGGKAVAYCRGEIEMQASG